MICPKCGKQITDESLFCNYCGKKLITEKKKTTKSRGNGQGTAYKRGSTWTACATVGWRLPKDPSKPKVPVRKTKGGFKTKKEAQNYCSQLQLATTERRRITLEECWIEWSEPYKKHIGDSTFAGYKSAYNHFKQLHGTFMNMIAIDELQKCVDATKGFRTRQNMKTVAGLLWKYCVSRNILDRDITTVLYVGGGQSVQRDPLTPEEVRKIRDCIGKVRYAEYLYVLAYLGFRPGEMLELRKDQLHHYIKKDENGAVTADIFYFINGKKTAAGKDRVVPISSIILDYILERTWIPGTDLLFPQYVFDRKKEKFVCFKQMSDEYLNKHVFKPLAKSLGIPSNKVPYSARHSFADLLKKADGTDKSKAALIGHSDYLFTQDRYQSDTIEELAALVESFEKDQTDS